MTLRLSRIRQSWLDILNNWHYNGREGTEDWIRRRWHSLSMRGARARHPLQVQTTKLLNASEAENTIEIIMIFGHIFSLSRATTERFSARRGRCWSPEARPERWVPGIALATTDWNWQIASVANQITLHISSISRERRKKYRLYKRLLDILDMDGSHRT
jgi:hypothetical protein